jgi:hypothetical protein
MAEDRHPTTNTYRHGDKRQGEEKGEKNAHRVTTGSEAVHKQMWQSNCELGSDRPSLSMCACASSISGTECRQAL